MPLTCPARVDLTAYLFGKLSGDRCQDIASHLEECEDCQAQLATVGDTGDTLLAGIRRRELASEFEHESALRRAIGRIEQFGGEPSQAGPSAVAPKTFDSGPIDLGTLGSYRLLAKLGEGGMGAVYKALHVHLEKIVAIKVLPAERLKDPAAVGRFRREMKVVGKLDHPHLVHAFDAGEVDGQHFLAMEYVQGQDLSTLSRRRGPLPIAEACELIRQAALGLAAAHEHGLVHRDVKPANLMLASGGTGGLPASVPGNQPTRADKQPVPPVAHSRADKQPVPPVAFVKVLDLGLALLAGQPAAADLTSTGQFMGTVDYMAPEQAGDSHNVDIRADVYSLGATLFKLLTGDAPFAGPKYATLISKMMALASETAPPLREKRPDAPAELEAVLAKMLRREVDQRYSTPGEVATALAPFCAGADLAMLLGDDELAAVESRVLSDAPAATLSTAPVSSQFVDSHADRIPHAPRQESPSAVGRVSNPSPHVGRVSDPSIPQSAAAEAVPRSLDEEQTGQRPVLQRSHLADRKDPLTLTLSPADGGEGTRNRKFQRALAALAGMILLVLGVFLIVRTREGEVVVELGEGVTAEDVKIEISGDDGLSIADKQNGWTIGVKEGRYDVKLAGGDDKFTIDKEEIVVTRGEETYLKVTLKAPEPSAEGGSESSDPDRRGAVYARSIGGQILIQMNGQDRAVVPGAELPKEPFRLTYLDFYNNQQVTDKGLANFKGCKHLTFLKLDYMPITDAGLAHFKDCRDLTSLILTATKLTDEGLANFQHCKHLTTLDLNHTQASDAGLAWFKACEKLTRVFLSNTQVEDLSPLAGMPLETLNVAETRVSDLTPLKDMHSLRTLSLEKTGVSDLSALAGLKLTSLRLLGTKITRLSPIKDMPLTELHFERTGVSDLAVLEGMPLHTLTCSYTPLENLSPLAGSKLVNLNLQSTRVVDLSPLKDLPLEVLTIADTKVHDLRPLAGMPLRELNFLHTDVEDFDLLKSIPTLVKINDLPAEEFWKSMGGVIPGAAKLAWQPTPEQQAFLDALASLEPKLQVEALTARLAQENPGFDGKFEHEEREGQIVRLKLTGPAVKNLWPLAGLRGLESLDLSASGVEDLSQLASLLAGLKSLDLTDTWVLDLTPLAACKKLEVLDCTLTSITDLRPLAGLPLVELTAPVSGDNRTACETIRSLSQLQKMNGRPPAEFLARRQKVDALAKQFVVLSRERQLKLVEALMREFNPGVEPKLVWVKQTLVAPLALQMEGIQVSDSAATDYSPLRAMPNLLGVACPRGGFALADLTPFAGSSVAVLSIAETRVVDLSPLALADGEKSPLRNLELSETRVADLSPLAGIKLDWLSLHGCHRVSDLSPLKGMPLKFLNGNFTSVESIEPLRGMPLDTLALVQTKVSDLSPLAGINLTILKVNGTPVSDLSPLKGMKLKTLYVFDTQVNDLSLGALQGMPLSNLELYGTEVTDLRPLQGMPLKSLRTGHRVRDLSPLRDMQLESLDCQGAPVVDLSPLKHVPLKALTISQTNVIDLSPLRGKPLEILWINGTLAGDFSALDGMPLKTVGCSFGIYDDESHRFLKSLTGLESPPNWVELYERRKLLEEFVELTATLSTGNQVEMVRAKLLTDIPQHPAKLDYNTADNVVNEVTLTAVTHGGRIDSLRAFGGLRKLTIEEEVLHAFMDLSPLAVLPLEELTCIDVHRGRIHSRALWQNSRLLRKIPTLKTINGRPAEEFWKLVDAGETPESLKAAAENEGFVPLFNTTDLTGWQARRSRTIEWKNDNGTISGKNRSDRLESGGVLVSEKEFKNFHFRCEVLAGPPKEAAIFFRDSDGLIRGARRGYAVVNPSSDWPAADQGWGIGSLYADDFQVPFQKSRLAQATVKDLGIKPGDWYKLEIIALDEKITIRVNDVTTAEFTSDKPVLNRAGHFGFTCQRGGEVSYRKLEVKELKGAE